MRVVRRPRWTRLVYLFYRFVCHSIARANTAVSSIKKETINNKYEKSPCSRNARAPLSWPRCNVVVNDINWYKKRVALHETIQIIRNGLTYNNDGNDA